MKKIGLVGGLGPASTIDYYTGLIDKTQREKGQTVYPEIVIDSVNMTLHDRALVEKDYDRLADYLIESIENLRAAGAEIAAITANTEHIIWDMVCQRFTLPVVSVVDATINEIKKNGYKRVLVFGTVFTLKSGLYDNALEKNEINAIIPTDNDAEQIGNLIYPNLENGIVIPEDRQKLIDIAEQYIAKYNADAMLLGCTELPLAIKPGDVSVPVLNTTLIHIEEIYKRANN